MRWALITVLVSVPLCAAELLFQAGPFEVITEDPKTGRLVLNHLEQFRHTYGQTMGVPDLKPRWPIRITVAKQSSDLKLGRDAYVATIARGAAVPAQWNRALAEIFLEDGTARMPAPLERGLIAFFSTLQVSGVRVTGGAPIAQPDLDWARVHLLMTSDEYRGKLRPLLFNLQRGNAPQPSYRNAFSKSAEEIEKEAQAYFRARQFGTVLLNAKPIDPERDFHPRAYAPRAVESPMDAFDAKDYAKAVALKPDWPEAKYRLAMQTEAPVEKIKLLREAAATAQRDARYWRTLAETESSQGQFAEAAKSWTAAERASLTDADRAQIRQARLALDDSRLNQLEEERRQKKLAEEAELNRLKNEAIGRIRLAESKARDASGGAIEAKPEAWWEDNRKLQPQAGTFIRLDCVGRTRYLVLQEGGKTLKMTLAPDIAVMNVESYNFVCGPVAKPPRVTVFYEAKNLPGAIGEAVRVEFSRQVPTPTKQ